jgi:hypothetical protein
MCINTIHYLYLIMTDTNNYLENYVYLCVERKCNYQAYFECKKFNSFVDANKEYFDNSFGSLSTMIPVSKYVPKYFHTYILNKELTNIYFKVKIVDEMTK